MRDDAEAVHSPVVDDATLGLLRRLLTLPDPEVARIRAATRRPPRDPQSGPSADYRDD